MFLTNNSPVLIPLVFLFAAMVLPLVAFKKERLAWPVAMLTLTTAVALAVYNICRVMETGKAIHYKLGGWAPPMGIEYVLDHLSAFIMLVINAVALLVLIHGKKMVERELPGKSVPYFTAALLMLCGFNGIVITGDLFNLYVFLEISSLSLYGILAIGQKESPVSAFRYLIQGVLGGSFYLLGVGFIYMTTGSLNMADVHKILPHVTDNPTILIAFCLMVLGMGIKMALFPLHGWLPDAYTYASSTSSALVAPTGTKVASYVMLRLLFFVFGLKFIMSMPLPITTIIAWLAAAGIIYGSIMAIAQKEMKRMLAYSSVAQVGYIALGFGLANPMGLVGAILHVLNHAFMKAGLFLVTGNMRYKLGHSRIDQLNNGIRKKMPWTMFAFTIGALSMVGLPPMAGFFSKWYLVLGTVHNSDWFFLAVILISSLLNLVYFFRILEKVYMKPLPKDGETQEDTPDPVRDEAPASMLIPTLVMAIGLIVLGIMNAYIVKGVINYIIPAGM